MKNFPKITAVETLAAGAGWRNYHFLKISTDAGITGWSEFDEDFGNPGISAVIATLAPRLIGQPVGDHERLYNILLMALKPATVGISAQALGAIENALLDAKAKALEVPCHQLLGGAVRDKVRVYWSHCGTWRISRKPWYEPQIDHVDGVKALAREVRDRGFPALKTNVYTYAPDGAPVGWAPGFGLPFDPGLNVGHKLIDGLREHLGVLRDAAGPDVGILLDLNFNAKPEGYIKIIRALADIDLFWVELDLLNADALADIRRAANMPVASCETLTRPGSFVPFLAKQAVDVAIIDLLWNGAWQSAKVAAMADAHDINVAPHNFYGHLATMMNLHFAAATPNLRIMETDIDRLAWDSELFTHEPEIVDGHMIVPDRPGWGTEPDEAALKRYPPNTLPNTLGLVTFGRNAD
ncbi:mandelate racemase/muconate lactonizing enzyme family protein [Sphingomonas canadensis]|uniref:Mandelate racemase/muconate lactonizing enzyme family protein n=1 Tax=Sphingomonas canadensis TaxID=1219257 RepID=A0ABW3HGR2_9SPHN|nr:mandelate racemase/muconate lactonizing enzyme family protein [Sphingomonas canadensis]MCW3838351.1 mandelate racemase/muconate lactonizing enzyme family protein [Sphingomonas canadensis]